MSRDTLEPAVEGGVGFRGRHGHTFDTFALIRVPPKASQWSSN